MNQLAPLGAVAGIPTLITAAGERAGLRFLEFFAANIRNPNTRRAYGRAVAEFLAWCADAAGVPSIAAVQPLHVATWVEMQTRTRAAPATIGGMPRNSKRASERQSLTTSRSP